jgi:pimeloyl-ACP methyl ester carboxylesterase
MTVETLIHCRVRLALHGLRCGEGRPLLLLHGLGERSPSGVPADVSDWSGPVAALDFTGHGASTVPVGGGYSAEILMADVDIALERLGPCTVVGRGVGAYAALLIAGARPSLVRGAVLCDGPGLWGGATGPTSAGFPVLHQPQRVPDPYALLELSRDLRPRDYAALFARLAIEHSGLDEPISVAATVRPPWLEAVVEEVGIVERPLADALRAYRSIE